MPRKKKSAAKNDYNPDYIDSATLSLITQLAQDADGSILAGARLLQATRSDIGIGTVYLRHPDHPRDMDRRIPSTAALDVVEVGTCEYSVAFSAFLPDAPAQRTREEHALLRGQALKDLPRYFSRSHSLLLLINVV